MPHVKVLICERSRQSNSSWNLWSHWCFWLMMRPNWYESGLFHLFWLPRGSVSFHFHLTLPIACSEHHNVHANTRNSPRISFGDVFYYIFGAPTRMTGWWFCLLPVDIWQFSQHRFLRHEEDGRCVTFQNIQHTHVIKYKMSMFTLSAEAERVACFLFFGAISWFDLHLWLLFLVSLPVTVAWDRSSSNKSTKLQYGSDYSGKSTAQIQICRSAIIMCEIHS